MITGEELFRFVLAAKHDMNSKGAQPNRLHVNSETWPRYHALMLAYCDVKPTDGAILEMYEMPIRIDDAVPDGNMRLVEAEQKRGGDRGATDSND